MHGNTPGCHHYYDCGQRRNVCHIFRGGGNDTARIQISLTAYFASATVIGLAVGFGLQGFVQDLVIGLTLIFSDALNIGEVVKLGDEIGKVEKYRASIYHMITCMASGF